MFWSNTNLHRAMKFDFNNRPIISPIWKSDSKKEKLKLKLKISQLLVPPQGAYWDPQIQKNP